MDPALQKTIGDALSNREQALLVVMCFVGAALVFALIALMRMRSRFRRHIEEHRLELRRAFAGAYVALKDSDAVDAKKIRDAERSIEKIITSLENFM